MLHWMSTDERLRKAKATIRRLKEAAVEAERAHRQEVGLLRDRIAVQDEIIEALREDCKAFTWRRRAEGMLDKGVASSLSNGEKA